MDHPDGIGELHGVDDAERICPKRQRDSNTPGPMPRIGLAMSALPPSAAIVRAARQIDEAPSGNVSNSFRAALIQATGRVRGVIVSLPAATSEANVVIYDNTRQSRKGAWELARPPRLERGTPGLEGRCSIQLSYGRVTGYVTGATPIAVSG